MDKKSYSYYVKSNITGIDVNLSYRIESVSGVRGLGQKEIDLPPSFVPPPKIIHYATFLVNTPGGWRTVIMKEVREVMDKLNHRPRKVLNYRTPYGVFNKTMDSLAVALAN